MSKLKKKEIKERLREYINKDPERCPFCKSTSIMGNNVEMNSGQVYQDVECSDCGRVWTDIYDLVAVEYVHLRRTYHNSVIDLETISVKKGNKNESI